MIMSRLMSRLTRTVASKGIWNAVRRYCVRTMGFSCLLSTTAWISLNSSLNLAISSALLPCAALARQRYLRPALEHGCAHTATELESEAE